MAKRTQTSIENNLTDPAQLHTEILQIAEENKDIIEAVDNYRERWKTVFPNGMLEELCVEFRCCPSMIFIALESFYSPANKNKFISQIQSCLGNYQGIYKIENTEQHLIYIGQTQASFIERWGDHIRRARTRSRTYPLYQALDKYGISSFTFRIVEIIEDQSKQYILDREAFYIEFFQSQCKNGGLNVDKPKWNQKLEDPIENSIFNALIEGKTNSEIVQQCSVSSTLVTLMRNGERHRRPDVQYPILSHIDSMRIAIYKKVVHLLKTTSKSLTEVAKLTGVSRSLVTDIYNYKIPKKVLKICPEMSEEVFQPRKPRGDLREKIQIADKIYYKMVCPVCETTFYVGRGKQKYCSSQCRCQVRQKAARPSRSELKTLIRTESFTQLAQRFGISDNAIRKWCKSMDLPSKASDEWERETWVK